MRLALPRSSLMMAIVLFGRVLLVRQQESEDDEHSPPALLECTDLAKGKGHSWSPQAIALSTKVHKLPFYHFWLHFLRLLFGA